MKDSWKGLWHDWADVLLNNSLSWSILLIQTHEWTLQNVHNSAHILNSVFIIISVVGFLSVMRIFLFSKVLYYQIIIVNNKTGTWQNLDKHCTPLLVVGCTYIHTPLYALWYLKFIRYWILYVFSVMKIYALNRKT